jgi:hypothetical protein
MLYTMSSLKARNVSIVLVMVVLLRGMQLRVEHPRALHISLTFQFLRSTISRHRLESPVLTIESALEGAQYLANFRRFI